MVNSSSRRRASQGGQAVVLVTLSLSIFLFGAMGMGIDASQLYAQRQMAQAAADAAAQAGIVTVFNGTTPAIGTIAYYCTAANTTSPCNYASKNGYTAGACTSGASAAPGADCIKVDPSTANQVQVTVTRAVPMTLLKMIGFSNLDVTARATAAILNVNSPVPLLLTDPWQPDALDLQGNASIVVNGGPQRSIQVNSTDPGSYHMQGSVDVDLSNAGPNGTGGDFGDFGGGGSSGDVDTGTTGHYLQPADPVQDPLASVPQPTKPGVDATAPITIGSGVDGCPSSCTLYSPGLYQSPGRGDINTGKTSVFLPGIYYMYGTSVSPGGDVRMATGVAADPNTGAGMVFFMTGPTTTSVGSGKNACRPAIPAAQPGSINLGNGNVNLTGADFNSTYKGILFFMDRSAVSGTTSMGGNASLTLNGTLYLSDSVTQTGTTSAATCGQFQSLHMGGTSAITLNGQIIVNDLSIQGGGHGGITFNLNSNYQLLVRQIALVPGE